MPFALWTLSEQRVSLVQSIEQSEHAKVVVELQMMKVVSFR